MKIKLLVGLLALTFCSSVSVVHDYYPQSFQEKIQNNLIKNEKLKSKLFKVLSTPHLRHENGPDTLGCSPHLEERCYEHTDLGYRRARKILFGSLHLNQDETGQYYIRDMYCNTEITEEISPVGPYTIPDHTIINTEHTWPQSRFARDFPRNLQRSDLHHLFPVDSHANNVRANHEMADVFGNPIREQDCTDSIFGQDVLTGNSKRFEPPQEYKGKIARALLYFSIRYKIGISKEEEVHLKNWHNQWPPSEKEIQRNHAIYKYQNNRNPFIDYPELVERIENF